jgi:MurNAc alpha-1-phosphate uridylyltransferase
MKAMLLAAGRGERLRPLSDRIPKPLIEVGGKALIIHLMEALVKAGYDDIVINLSWLGDAIRTTLADGSRYGAKLSYSPEPDNALETGGGILNALPLLGEAPFLAVSADIYTDFSFASLANEPKGLAHLVLVDNPPHNSGGDFAIDNGRLRNQGDRRLTFSGIGVYRPQLFQGRSPGRFPLAPLLREAASDDRATAEHFGGEWWDVGSIERLDALRSALAKR